MPKSGELVSIGSKIQRSYQIIVNSLGTNRLLLRSDRNLLEGQVEQINRFCLDFAALTKILQDDSRWVVSQQKSLQLHFMFLFYLKLLNNSNMANLKKVESRE